MANTIFETVSKFLDDEVKEPLRQYLMMPQLFGKVKTVPEGKSNIEHWVLTDVGDATIEMAWAEDVERDAPALTPSVLKIPLIRKGYKLDKNDVDAYGTSGIPFETIAVQSAAYKVAKKIDPLLLNGWAPNGSTYTEASGGIIGLTQGASTTQTTSKDFGTFGYPTDKVALVLAEFDTNNVTGVNFNLTLNPTQYRELQASRSANGVREWPDIESMLNGSNGPKGMIRSSPNITAGSALFTAVDTAGIYFDMVRAQGGRNSLGMDSKLGELSPVYGIFWAKLRPRVINGYGICYATGC